MYYYEVLVGDLSYHGKSALTYASPQKLAKGIVVRIALRDKSVLGITTKKVSKPAFAVKPIAAIAEAPPLSAESLQLIDWLYAYYPASFGSVIRLFLPPTTAFPKNNSEQIHHSPVDAALLPKLTTEQHAALQHIQSSGYHLLHGITGSGKTRVYIELAKRTLAENRSVIILTPEIGLTAQLVKSIESSLSAPIFVLHSRQTTAERRDIWYAIIRSTRPVVVIGPRSALFAPVHNLGLIVIDEAHDQAYKNENAPYYRTERVAAKLAELYGACIVSGSATPNIEEYYVASVKKRPIITLQKLATQEDDTMFKVATHIVDMRERSNFAKSNVMSDRLIELTRQALVNREQTLLFLNRRGTAGAILCNACGWQALCTHCDLPLTYHGDNHITRCHVCGRTWPLPTSCSECGNTDLLLKTIGTKAVVEEAERLFPGVKIHRFDSDVEKLDQIEQQITELQKGNIDIIIGTQMITKGLDLPKLSVVGVLSADSSLAIPDYSTSERTYQILTQVIGRTGRGHRSGSVVIQTYNPDQPIIRAAAAQDWSAFYDEEIRERNAFHFPPFVFLLKLTCARATSKAAEKAATTLMHEIEKSYPRVRIEGPSPGLHPKEHGKFRWQLIIKSTSRPKLIEIIQDLPSGWTRDIDPITLL
jgi:primosomal protein N' (replication factor Y)